MGFLWPANPDSPKSEGADVRRPQKSDSPSTALSEEDCPWRSYRVIPVCWSVCGGKEGLRGINEHRIVGDDPNMKKTTEWLRKAHWSGAVPRFHRI